MRDVFTFQSPFGPLGSVFNLITLKDYMTSLLKQRNLVIKQVAEADKWQAKRANSKKNEFISLSFY